jgi:hypothetical protein
VFVHEGILWETMFDYCVNARVTAKPLACALAA